ncbi:MAG: hypothetical protein HKP30_06135, partial [Myxococcales bacterium]|nr:hypothetical protein [Myxococcales bacterium]
MPEPPDPEPAREPRSHPDRGRLAGAASGLAIGLLTTTLLAAIDLGAALLELRDLAWGGSPVVDLIVAAFGEFAWSHGLVVLPLAAAAGAAWPGRPAWA